MGFGLACVRAGRLLVALGRHRPTRDYYIATCAKARYGDNPPPRGQRCSTRRDSTRARTLMPLHPTAAKKSCRGGTGGVTIHCVLRRFVRVYALFPDLRPRRVTRSAPTPLAVADIYRRASTRQITRLTFASSPRTLDWNWNE